MKIYEIGTGYTPIPAQMGAATEIVVEELAKAFIKQNIPVEIIDITAKNRKAHTLPIREVKVPNVFSGTDVQLGLMHKLKRVVYSIALAEELKNILMCTDERIVLHFHNQYNLFFFYKLVPKRLQKKVVVVYTNHSYIWHNPWCEIKETIRKRYFQEVYCMEHADHVFVLNEQTQNTITENLNIDSDKVHLIGNGVNTEVYRVFDSCAKDENKRKWELQDRRVLIQVGSVCERKNQLGAVKSLLPILKQYDDLMFCYAGGIIDDEYQERIENYVEENELSDSVRYVGELTPGEQLNSFYNLAEAMVFPSKAEGFSLVILEAMSSGIPVLISKNLKFEMDHHCIPCLETEFAEVVKQEILDANKQAVLSDEVRKVVESEYSWEKIASKYFQTWNDEIL